MVLPEYYLKYEKLLSRLKMESQWIDAEKRIAELRYRPDQARNANGTFKKENNSFKVVDKSGNSGIIKSKEKSFGSGQINNIEIGKSLGASGKNYPVKLPDGNHSKFAEGTEIVDIKIFAGKGTNDPIKEAVFLENNYKIKSSEWSKVRGTGYVLDNNVPRKAEVHWYEAGGLKVKMKVKRWYDES